MDAIFASYTLGCWIGRMEGTLVVQPWPFGTELGVVELAREAEPKAYGITPETSGPWTGTGGGLLGETSSKVLGELARSLLSRSGGPSPLTDLRHPGGGRHARVAGTGGRRTFLPAPAGPLTEADVLRLYPWPDDTVAGHLTPEELRAIAQAA